MSYVNAKMHQIRFWLGLLPRPNPAGEAHSAPPDFLGCLDLGGPTSKGGEGIGRKLEGRKLEGRKRENGEERKGLLCFTAEPMMLAMGLQTRPNNV